MPITKKDIQDVTTMVQRYWPDYSISEDLKKPTRHFAIEFYSKVIEDLESKISFITGGKTDCLQSLDADLDLEVKLYQMLMRFVPTLKNVDFKLGDILCPTPVRTNRYMHICMHFLLFTYERTESTHAIVQESIAKSTQTEKTEEKNQQLLLQIAATSEKLGMELEGLQKIKNEHKQLKEQWKAKHESYIKIKNKTDNIQKTYDYQQAKLKKLEKTVQQLKEQVVTEEEQQHLKQAKLSLLSDVETLKLTNVEVGDGFHQQRETINHFENCLRLLKNLHMSSNISTCHKIKQQLMNEEQELHNMNKDYEQQKNNGMALKDMKMQLEKNRKKQTDKVEKFQAQLDEAVHMLESLSKNIVAEYQALRNNEKVWADLLNDTLKCRADLEKLQKAFQEKYEKIKEKRTQTMGLFGDHLSKFKEKLKRE